MVRASGLALLPTLRVGPVEIRPGTREVIGPGGGEIVEPRVMQVLVCLIEAQGEIVTRDALVERCWDGRAVSEDAINRVIARIRRLAAEIGAGSFAIKTVHKVGYRLIDTPAEAPPATKAAPVARQPAAFVRRFWPMIALLLAAAMLTAFLAWRQASAVTPPTLGILPFRATDPTDAFFAAGVSEEVTNQLVRDGEVRVVGRSAATVPDADARSLGRQLGAIYLLEGSVRSEGERMRITVALVRTADGVRIWSRSFDGREADALQVQQQVGIAVSEALAVRLKKVRPSATVSGESARLYFTARGLLRSRESAKIEVASNLLEEAVRIEPRYAPAWAALGKARLMKIDQANPNARAARAEALSNLTRALSIAPDLAEAHAAVALAHGFRGPAAAAHIARAASLSPDDAEIQFWLGHAFGSRGEFDAQLRAYRRAAELDPLWLRASWHAAQLALELGRAEEARAVETMVRSLNDERSSLALTAHLAIAGGDLSAAFSAYRRLERLAPVRDGPLRMTLLSARRLLGLLEQSRHAGFAFSDESRVWRGEVPPVSELVARAREGAFEDFPYLESAAKNHLSSGTTEELAGLYFTETGLLGWSARAAAPLDLEHVQTASTVALVLRGAGREAEARLVLGSAERLVDRLSGQTAVPTDLLVACARLWAVSGKTDRAVKALDLAIRRGWLPLEQRDRADLRRDPALALLGKDPRFAGISRELMFRIARERRESQLLAD